MSDDKTENLAVEEAVDATTSVEKKRSNETKAGSDEEIDDLFGDDEEGSEGIDDVEAGEAAESGEEAADEEIEEETLQRAELTLPRHPRSHLPLNNDVSLFNLPRFLSVDPEPFAPNTFEEQIEQYLAREKEEEKLRGGHAGIKNSVQFKKLQLLNTIRWRYAKTPDGGLSKQSNAKIVEWEDGTMSLKLGNEYFEIRTNRNDDEMLAFQGGQVLMGYVGLNKSIKVLPPSTKSIAHKILASTIQSNMKSSRGKKINTMVTRVDPELKARETERAQREIERARRKQQAKIEEEEERLRRDQPGEAAATTYGDIEIGEEEEEEEDYIPSAGGHGQYEKDDFVVDDEEEIEERDDDELDEAAERLRQVKREGAQKYKRGADETHPADEDEEDAVVIKKRRVVLDDDDEE